MSKVLGNPEGLQVLNKLRSSHDPEVYEYYERLRKTILDGKLCVYFSDFEEQKKKRLNNQITYKLFFELSQRQWFIEVFSVPTPPK